MDGSTRAAPSGDQITISDLIRSRCTDLNLTDAELVRRAGYRNTSKGLRRLQQLRTGDLNAIASLLAGLAGALELSPEAIKAAVAVTRRQLRMEEEATWRAAFVPHAIIVCERSRPEPLFVAFVIGVDRLIRIEFASASAPVSYVAQALAEIKKRLAAWKSEVLPAFGRPTGLIINYTPDWSVEFDLDGRPLGAFDEARRPGTIQMSFGRRPITGQELGAILAE